MSRSVADIVAGAVGHSVANSAPSLTANTFEMISKVAAFERDAYTAVAAKNRFFWDSFDTTSNDDSAGRFVDTAVAGNVERLVQVTFTDTGAVLHPVDLEDTDAEIAPRYYMRGTLLTEVGSDWGASGTVNLTYGYAQSPGDLDPTGSATQPISLPDRYADLLEIRLAAYLAGKDLESRDPNEVSTLNTRYQERLSSVIASLDQYGGAVRRRFVNPSGYPLTSE